MDGARVYFEAYTDFSQDDDGEYVESLTACLLFPREGETEFIFGARVQAHVDILNQHDESADEDVGYDWELVPIVS